MNQYKPNDSVWYHRGTGNQIQATFVKYNKKTVTIIVHFKYAGDRQCFVKVDEISPRSTLNTVKEVNA